MTTDSGDQEVVGTYRALPVIDEDIFALIFDDRNGLIVEFLDSLGDIGAALRLVDAEMIGLEQANPDLGAAVRRVVSDLDSLLGDALWSETNRSYLRVVGYINAFLVLRLLDMQWRKQQPS